MIYLLILFVILFFVTTVFFSYVSYTALTKIRKYEEFYEETSEDIGLVLQSLDQIINRRPLLSDDPDVHRMVKGIKIVQGILSEYGKYKKRGSENSTENK